MSTFSFVSNLVKDKLGALKGASASSVQEETQKAKIEGDIFSNVTKASILQECKCFNESQINDRKCKILLSRLIYLINQGEKFTEAESSMLFFSITKLFQSNNYDLRRMIYLIIKELRNESSIYIITSSVTKDMNSKVDLFRMNALRTIPIIIDPTNILQIERYIKNAIIDKNFGIANSALLAGLHIFSHNSDLVRKWANEVMEKLSSEHNNCHYHALILLNEIKKKDKLSFIKVLASLTKETRNSTATIQLIRFVKEALIHEDLEGNIEKSLFDFLLKQTLSSCEIVCFEACKAVCDLPNISNQDLAPILSTLQIFLISSSSVNKFASLRILNKLISNPARALLLTNTADLENILSDNNRSLSSLAISVLLKICKEDNVEKLLNQIYEYLGDISDEFKIDIVQSTKGLIKRSPNKYKAILTFLSNCLKSESKCQFKKHCLEKIEFIMNEIPSSKESALLNLVEYAEDCPFPSLHLYIFEILIKQIMQNFFPARLIRFIYNRVTLENNEVRAGAVSALGKITLQFPELAANIKTTLQTLTQDSDEEVRERSIFYLLLIEESEKKESKNEVYECIQEITKAKTDIDLNDIDVIEQYIHSNMSLLQNSSDVNLLSEQAIQEFAAKFDKKPKEESKKSEDAVVSKEAEKPKSLDFTSYKKNFAEHPVFSSYGPLRHIGQQKSITDPKAEYLVEVNKYIFDDHLILEFVVQNMLPNIFLKDVSIDLSFPSADLQPLHSIPASQLPPLSSSNIFIGLSKNPGFKFVITNISSFLKFEVNELNNDTKKLVATYDDEYQLDDFELSLGDWVGTWNVGKKWGEMWNVMDDAEEETFQIEYKSIEAAIKGVVRHFANISLCEETDQYKGANPHTLKLAGIYLNNIKFLIQCMIGLDAKIGCILKIQVKTVDLLLASNLRESIIL